MTARIYYVVREQRAPIDELLTATPLQRFIDLERATRDELEGDGLKFSDVRGYLTRALNATNQYDLVASARDILLYRAIAWLVILHGTPDTPFSDVADISIGDVSTAVSGLEDEDESAPKDQLGAEATSS